MGSSIPRCVCVCMWICVYVCMRAYVSPCWSCPSCLIGPVPFQHCNSSVPMLKLLFVPVWASAIYTFKRLRLCHLHMHAHASAIYTFNCHTRLFHLHIQLPYTHTPLPFTHSNASAIDTFKRLGLCHLHIQTPVCPSEMQRHVNRVDQDHVYTVYIRYFCGISGRKITKNTVYVHISGQPYLLLRCCEAWQRTDKLRHIKPF